VNGWSFPTGRDLDLLCVGRAGVDFYAEQDGVALEDVRSFRKSVGGSPANIATAVARLGGRAGVIGAVSNDGFGRYVRRFLVDNGVDVAGLKTAPDGVLNSAAFTEMRPVGCSVIIYRRDAADLRLQPADIDPARIASARALLVSGTALSASPSREACLHAMTLAREAGTAVVIDLDHRPHAWASLPEAAAVLAQACAMAELVIGNREEFDVLEHRPSDIARGEDPRDDASSARRLLSGVTQAVIVKDGERGCRLFFRDGSAHSQGIFAVQARKPFGSGDAFAGTLLWALFAGRGWAEAARLGAAAAALNVSRDGCAEAMATEAELFTFIAGHPAYVQA
jgi:5-dehydro-2-deoxygluconokinase